jgi:hypothetical protein
MPIRPSMRRMAIAAGFALLCSLAPAECSVAAPIPGTTCDVFAADNVWNMDVSALPLHRKNKDWKRSTHAGSTLLHPDFGDDPYGFPFAVTDSSTPITSIDFTYDDESDPGPYPFRASTPIEDGSDRHALMVDRDACVLYELFDADWHGGNPTAGSGAIFDLGSNGLRPKTWTSADAAGLPILPGLVRYDEVQSGSIDHAIRFTVSCTRNTFVWPARHQAGVNDKDCPPMGARFRLKASFDLSGFSPNAQVILTAMQRYGMIVADNGSDWLFQGTLDPGWTNGLLDQLKTIPASAFQGVDESACKVGPDSAQFQYGPGCPGP